MGRETGHAVKSTACQKMSRQIVCGLHFSENDFAISDERSLDRLAAPNPSTGASNSNSA